MKPWRVLKKELLKDKEFCKEYERLEPYYQIVSQIIKARLEKGFTQKKLAQKVGTKQSNIARFESGQTNPTLGFVEKITRALGLKITFQVN